MLSFSDYLNESKLPEFNDYAEAMDWVERRVGALGLKSLNDYYTTDEYKLLYPKIVKLYKIEKQMHSDRALDAMGQSGVNFGDKVYYDSISPFMTVENFEGVIVNRNGMPWVKLNKPVNGKQFVKWHKGWHKVK